MSVKPGLTKQNQIKIFSLTM